MYVSLLLLSPAKALLAARAEGNAAFKRGAWAAAVEAYTRALSVDPGHARFNAILYANRAAAWGHRDKLQQVIGPACARPRLPPASATCRRWATAPPRWHATPRTPRRIYAVASCACGAATCADRFKSNPRRADHPFKLLLTRADPTLEQVPRAKADFKEAARLDSGAVGIEAAKRLSELRQPPPSAGGGPSGAGGGAGFGGGGAGASGGYGAGRGGPRFGGGAGGGGSSSKPAERSYYVVLGVSEAADADEIRKAYKKLARPAR